MINLRFVMTGGPGAGKTTVLEALAMRGFACVPDSARAIIRQRKGAGLSPRPAPAQFGREMLEADMAQYRETPVHRDPVFFERGVCDALGFLAVHRAISGAEAAARVKEFPYNEVVFLLPPWEEIYTVDTERDQSFSEAVAVCESVRQWYTRWGYQLLEVPKGNVEERVNFILRTVRIS
jgi:predicted ATPase